MNLDWSWKLDFSYLEDVTQNKTDAIVKILGQCCNTLPTKIADLDRAATEGDVKKVGDIAHAIKGQITLLESIQSKAIRFISNIQGRDTSITAARKKLKLPILEKRRRDARYSLLIHILANETLFPSLISFYDSSLPDHHHTTRSSTTSTPLAVSCNTNIFLNSFLPRTARELRTGVGQLADI